MSSEIRVGQRPGSRYEDNWDFVKKAAVIARENQTYFGENLQRFLKSLVICISFSFVLKQKVF